LKLEEMLFGGIRMTNASQENGTEPYGLPSTRMGMGSWTILIVLLVLLAATMVVAYLGWTSGSGIDMPASGYIAMGFGVVISLGVGFGLMALIFYSSRKGYDAPPVLISPDGDGSPSDTASES
jgi:hypothetical protein